ncbi:MAG: LysR family transcriptional regulator [Rhizobiales bacterium]|nr:LysR family transcriptional regulator [Hyphomicrobiales bacterium]
MELKWLEDFLSLCETGNFRISSEYRFVSQPAFSRRIKSLESWIGAELIDRSFQPTRLTRAGEVFKPIAIEIVHLAVQSQSDVKAQIKAENEKIRFSTLSTLAQFFIPAWLKGLQSSIETEAFSVKTGCGNVDEYLSGLEEGQVDFFISYEDPSRTIFNNTEKFRSLLLGHETLIPIVSPDANGEPRFWLPTAKPGNSIPYLHTYSNPLVWPIKAHIEKRFSDLNFEPIYESSIATAIKAMVLEGYGVAWVPKSVVAEDLAAGRLVRAATIEDDISLDIKIYSFEPNAEPKTEKFWQVLLSKYADKEGHANFA